MRAVRGLVGELVERRLWPLALLLVLALVAVPLLLAKSPAQSADDAGPALEAPLASSAAAPEPAPPEETVVSVAQDGGPRAPLRGHAKNPFRQQHVQDEDGAQVATAATSEPSGGEGSDASDGGQGSGGGGDASGGAQPSEPSQPSYVYTSIDVRFGHTGAPLQKLEDVRRLTPLPRTSHPVVIFLGMRHDRETAVFMLSTDVKVQGLGRCVPSRSVCEAIELRRGDTVLMHYTTTDGTVTQYELDLVDVVQHTTASQATASRAYARASRQGHRLLRRHARTSAGAALVPARVPFRYVERLGVLHIAPYASQRARHARARRATGAGRLVDLAPRSY
jgi:hypothetical protein